MVSIHLDVTKLEVLQTKDIADCPLSENAVLVCT